MNNEIFKKVIKLYVDDAIEDLGGIDKVRAQHEQWSMVSFIAGYVVASVNREDNDAAIWRDPVTVFDKLNQEEIRRVFDFVRLRLESDSATS